MGGALSQKHFISMVIKVPLLLKKAARARPPPLTFSCLHAAMLLCLSLYMLDVQSGSLWWYNQPPAEPAFCSSPAAFCPLELLLQPRPLIVYRMCIQHLLSSIFSSSPFLFPYFSTDRRDICITPSCCGNSCRCRERE